MPDDYDSPLAQAYQALMLAKKMRDRHAINKWKHRIKVLKENGEK